MLSTTKNILIGHILGDGFLYPPTKREGKSQLESKYSDKSLEYLIWLREGLSELNPGPIKPHQNDQHLYRTKASKELGELRKLFYPKGKKIVPKEIKSLLTDPISLAVWYMDDGTLDFRERYHCNAMIATYGFSFSDCKLLVNTLHDNFDIKSIVTVCTMRGIKYPRLYVWAKDSIRFLNLIEPYILPCMEHKIVKCNL